jgi:hypothetical protein
MKTFVRLVLVGVVCAFAALGASAKTAEAAFLTCADSTEQPFAPWGDDSQYTLAPNGSFEEGSAGWSISGGARVVGENNALRSGRYSLVLPGGSSATSPSICLKVGDPATRFFLRNRGSSNAVLKVEVTYRTLLGLFPVTETLGYAEAGGGWQPGPKFGHQLAAILGTLGLADGASASVRFKFTPVGSGNGLQIDDLFVDPLVQA